MGRERYRSRSFRKGEKESSGCMSGVLHFFDFHQIQFCTQPRQQSQEHERDSLQGLEAPRNSLELDVETSLSFTPTSVVEDIPIGIRLHPVKPKSLDKDLLSETSSLQGSKTPNLVARLMGLDILPDEISPRPSYSPMRCQSSRASVQRRDGILPVNETTRYDSGIRSLPGTPRISSARRSDLGPRLSLQLNKENAETPEFNYCNRSAAAARDSFSSSSPFASRRVRTREGRTYEENRSPTTYAREIVKQVKESVSRRVGLDITNMSSRNRCSSESVVSPTMNVRKSNKKACRATDESKQSKTPTTPSCSPRPKCLETKRKSMENKEHPISSNSNSPKPHPISTTSTTPLQSSAKPKSKPLPKATAKCRKATCERFTQRPSSTSQANNRKQCKNITLSNQIRPPSNTIQNPAPAQTVFCSLSPCGSGQQQRQQYEEQHQKPKQPRNDQDDSRIRTTVTVTDGADFRYVNEILQRTKLDPNATWFDPLDLDPTLFHQLEQSFHATSGPLQQRCNRRLIFDLIHEILHNSIMPQLNMRCWLKTRKPVSPFSSNQLLSQVRSAPDIDGLVGFDLSRSNVRWGECCGSQDDEGESIMFELERVIMGSLVEETVRLMMISTRKRGWRVGEIQSQPLRAVIEM